MAESVRLNATAASSSTTKDCVLTCFARCFANTCHQVLSAVQKVANGYEYVTRTSVEQGCRQQNSLFFLARPHILVQ